MTTAPEQPVFTGNGPFDGFYFDPEWRWYPGDFDRATLREELAQVKGLEPFTDDVGNAHGSVVLLGDPDGAAGVWVVAPAGTDWKPVKAAVGRHDATAAAAPTVAEVAAILRDPEAGAEEKWAALATMLDPAGPS